MQTRIMQTQQLLGFSRFASQHLEESWSEVIGLTEKKVKLGRKSVLAKRIKRQMGIYEVFLMMMPSMGHRWTIDDPSMGIKE